jgi:hypothetical protein
LPLLVNAAGPGNSPALRPLTSRMKLAGASLRRHVPEAERHDTFAKAHPLVVEMAKSDDSFTRREMLRATHLTPAAKGR